MVSSSTSSSSSPLFLLPATFGDKHNGAKQFSKMFLGHGYNPLGDQGKKLLGTAFRNVNINSIVDKIEVVRKFTYERYVLANNREEAIQLLLGEFFLNIDFSDFERDEYSPPFEGRKAVFATVLIKGKRCQFQNNEMPLLTEEFGPNDCVVKAGWVYTGYKMLFEIIFPGKGGFPVNPAVSNQLESISKKIPKAIKSKNYSQVCVKARGFGDFVFPEFRKPESWNKIRDVFKMTKDHFLARKNSIMIRQFVIDETDCLARYSDIVQISLGRVPSTSTSSTTTSSSSSLSSSSTSHSLSLSSMGGAITLTRDECHELADKIKSQASPASQHILEKVMGDLSIGFVLISIQTVFTKIFKDPFNLQLGTFSYSLVIGNSGAGKSTFIGYQLGAKLALRDQDDDYITTLDYEADVDAYPCIGHDASQTKGYSIYQKYIDTAGLLDTAGREEEMCNGMAVSMATKLFSPNRLIIVLSSADFSNPRGLGVFKLLDKLKRILRDPANPVVLSSILFLINDKHDEYGHKNRITEDLLMKMIERAIRTLSGEINKLIPGYSSSSTSGSSSRSVTRLEQIDASGSSSRGGSSSPLPMTPFSRFISKAAQVHGKILDGLDYLLTNEEDEGELKRTFSSMHPDDVKKVIDYQNQITILERLKRDNFIVADFLLEETRLRVDQWESSHGQLNVESFTMENFVNNGYVQFKTVFTAVTAHFNRLFEQKNDCLRGGEEINGLIQRTELNVRDNDQIHSLKEEIGGLKEQISALDIELEAYPFSRTSQPSSSSSSSSQSSISSSSPSSRSPQPSHRSPPTSPLSRRTRLIAAKPPVSRTSKDGEMLLCELRADPPIQPRPWYSVASFATCYSFEYKKGIPISTVKLCPKKGEFLNPVEDLKKGVFRIQYLPGWWNYSEDCDTKVKIYVAEGDHPARRAEIEAIERNMASKRARRLELERRVFDLEEQLQSLQHVIEERTQDDHERDNKVKTENFYAKQLSELNERRLGFESALTEINLELAKYKNYCKLIRDIIYGLNFDQSENESEAVIYSEFCENVNIYCSDIP